MIPPPKHEVIVDRCVRKVIIEEAVVHKLVACNTSSSEAQPLLYPSSKSSPPRIALQILHQILLTLHQWLPIAPPSIATTQNRTYRVL
jgi:hypothetical protein